MVITQSDGVSFGDQIFVLTNPEQKLDAPSLDEGMVVITNTCFNYSHEFK